MSAGQIGLVYLLMINENLLKKVGHPYKPILKRVLRDFNLELALAIFKKSYIQPQIRAFI